MNTTVTAFAATIATLLLTAGSAVTAEDVPYGHPDYYPSVEQPAQLRGDGSGWFPGSNVVDSFNFKTKENIIWACPLPGWGFSSPIIVGDKAFVTCDWNKLICVDVRRGEILWAKDNHTFDVVGGDKADELKEMFDQLTIPWLRAHQVFFERSYIERELDLIDAARTGKPFKPSEVMNRKKKRMQSREHWGNHVPGNHLTEEEEKRLLIKAKSVDDATLQELRDRFEELSQIIKDDQLGPQTSGYVGTLNPHQRKSEKAKAFDKSLLPNGMSVSQAMKTLNKHGIVFEIWNGWMSRSFSTPASDGEHVFAQFGQSQVVCYDLVGNRQWMTPITIAGTDQSVNYGNRRQNDSASLILAEDKVIVLMGGGDYDAETYLQALDKRTGEMLWQTKLEYGRSSHSFPNQTRLKDGDIDVIVTSAGNIVRTADGKIIMKDLPAPIAPPLVVGNEVYLICGSGQSNGHGARMKITLHSDGGEIVGTIDWAYITKDKKTRRKLMDWVKAVETYAPGLTIGDTAKDDPHSDVGSLLIDGMVVTRSGIYDAATGKVQKNYGRGIIRASGHLIRTGNDLIWSTAGDEHTTVWDVKNLAAPKSHPLGSEWHRRIQLGEMTIEEGAKNVVDFPWLPHSTGHLGGFTTVWPQGSRLYIRRHDTLYCIGDPDVPYHSPSSAPAAARTDQ